MKTHRFDAVSFFSGLVIALLGLVFLIPQTPMDIVHAVTNLGSWFWPLVLVAIGVGILIPILLPKREDET
jgi:formate-dependent nitrite reductase membrane component NrfD